MYLDFSEAKMLDYAWVFCTHMGAIGAVIYAQLPMLVTVTLVTSVRLHAWLVARRHTVSSGPRSLVRLHWRAKVLHCLERRDGQMAVLIGAPTIFHFGPVCVVSQRTSLGQMTCVITRRAGRDDELRRYLRGARACSKLTEQM